MKLSKRYFEKVELEVVEDCYQILLDDSATDDSTLLHITGLNRQGLQELLSALRGKDYVTEKDLEWMSYVVLQVSNFH